MKLRTKILLMSLPVIATVALSVGFALFSFFKEESKRDIDENAISLLNQTKSAFDNHIVKSNIQLDSISNNYLIQEVFNSTKLMTFELKTSKALYYFKNIKKSNPSFKNLYFINNENNLIFSTNRNIRKHQRWVKKTLKKLDLNQSTNIHDVSPTGLPILISSKTVTDIRTNKVIGKILLTENYSFFDYIENKNQDEKIVLIKEEKVIRNPSNFIDAIIFANNERNKTLVNHHDSFNTNNQTYFYYLISIDEKLSIAKFVSNENHFDFIKYIGLSIIVISLLLTLTLGVILSSFTNRMVVKRIKSINHQTEKRLNSVNNTQDEFGELTRSYEKMKDSLTTSQEKINQLAFFDELTGLPNRRTLNQMIEKSIENSHKHKNNIAILMIDLDDFKDVNDIHGHEIGDDLLIEISKIIKNCVTATIKEKHLQKRIDFKLCRISGDEFTILIQGFNTNSIIQRISQNIVSSFTNKIKIKNIELKSTISLGVSLYPQHGMDRHNLLKNADLAMYEAKNRGKNCYQFFHDGIMDKINAKKEMENKIKHAVANDEFVLYFQPKVSTKDNSITEFEALIRWFHPEEKFISPGIFIPFAEENGLINSIGNWVVENLCKQIKDLEKRGWTNFKISFNTSPQQLQDQFFTNNIEQCIKKYSINPAHLEMEITEHSLAKDLSETILHLNKVKAMGIGIALDDFGTGYSSLSYLEKMPIDTIKIDRSFVSDCHKKPARLAIIETIITLAKGLNMTTVAEGVETIEELEVIKEKGVDFIQGFYYYPPISIEKIKEIYCTNYLRSVA